MLTGYKFRIYPTVEQSLALAKAMGCVRWFWNFSLALCQQTYKETGKCLYRGDIQGLLPSLKKEKPWLKTDCYSQSLQVVALNLTKAYENFYCKRSQLPSFKSKKGKQTISYPQNVSFDGDNIKLPKIGRIYCKVHREIEGVIKTVTISKLPSGNYYASLLVDDGKELPTKSSEGKAIGLDVGIADLVVTSDGSKFNNPLWLDKHEKNLKRKQQSLARKQKGSKNRDKARRKVAKVHNKIARCREDFLHKLSCKIVNENQVIVLEDLNTKAMVRNPKLSKAISQAGWGLFATMLKYKAEREGKTYLEIGRFFPSSKTCNPCLYKVIEMPLDVRSWTCPKCNSNHDRDINAAKNIRDEGLRILSLGTSDTASRDFVRPTRRVKSNPRQESMKEEAHHGGKRSAG